MPAQITEWSDALFTSLAAAMALLFSAIPKIIGFAIIAVAGWLIASLAEKGVAALLRAARFNHFAERAGLSDFTQRMGVKTDPAGVLGEIVKWFVRLIALVVAFDALGLPAVSDVLRQLLLWLPNVVVAIVALVIGGLAAKALGGVVRGAASEAGFTNPGALAKAASALIWAFAIVVAVNQLGIATELVDTLFMAAVGAVALALGLAFGLGGRDTAGEIVRDWRRMSQEKSGQIERLADAAAERTSQAAGRMAPQAAARTASQLPPRTGADERFAAPQRGEIHAPTTIQAPGSTIGAPDIATTPGYGQTGQTGQTGSTGGRS